MLDRIARARAKARAHAWQLIEGTAAGFPWLVIAGKTLAGWHVIDLDAALVTASSDQEGAAPTWKKASTRWAPGLANTGPHKPWTIEAKGAYLLRMPANISRGTRGATSSDAATVRWRRYVETSVKESSVNEAIKQ